MTKPPEIDGHYYAEKYDRQEYKQHSEHVFQFSREQTRKHHEDGIALHCSGGRIGYFTP